MARHRKAPIPPPTPVEGSPNKGLTRAEMVHRRALVEQIMLSGGGESAVARLCRDQWRLGRKAALRLMERVKVRWAAELERDRAGWKAEQVQRLKNDLAILMTEKHPDEEGPLKGKPKRNWTAIVSIERLLADVTGTREPLKVDVDVAGMQAIDRVALELSPRQFEAAVLEHLRTLDLAHQARTVLRLPDGREVQEPVAEEPRGVLNQPDGEGQRRR